MRGAGKGGRRGGVGANSTLHGSPEHKNLGTLIKRHPLFRGN